jgi:large subunit ribosomal protein L29
MRNLRDMSSQERERRLRELRTELSRLKTMVEAGGAVENPARIRELKRTVARILTVENEEKIGAEKK